MLQQQLNTYDVGGGVYNRIKQHFVMRKIPCDQIFSCYLHLSFLNLIPGFPWYALYYKREKNYGINTTKQQQHSVTEFICM